MPVCLILLAKTDPSRLVYSLRRLEAREHHGGLWRLWPSRWLREHGV